MLCGTDTGKNKLVLTHLVYRSADVWNRPLYNYKTALVLIQCQSFSVSFNRGHLSIKDISIGSCCPSHVSSTTDQ